MPLYCVHVVCDWGKLGHRFQNERKRPKGRRHDTTPFQYSLARARNFHSIHANTIAGGEATMCKEQPGSTGVHCTCYAPWCSTELLL